MINNPKNTESLLILLLMAISIQVYLHDFVIDFSLNTFLQVNLVVQKRHFILEHTYHFLVFFILLRHFLFIESFQFDYFCIENVLYLCAFQSIIQYLLFNFDVFSLKLLNSDFFFFNFILEKFFILKELFNSIFIFGLKPVHLFLHFQLLNFIFVIKTFNNFKLSRFIHLFFVENVRKS